MGPRLCSRGGMELTRYEYEEEFCFNGAAAL